MNQRRNKLTGKQIRKIVIALLIAAVVITGAVIILRKEIAQKYGESSKSNITSAEVTSGTISTSVSGSGTLSDDDVVEVTVPDGVEIKKIYVSRGDSVEVGDILASVNTNTVLTALADLSDELDELDEEINEAADETVSSTVTSKVAGRVKKIFVSAGDNVASAMYDSKALMLISMDGCMAVDITTEALAAGDTVTVTDSNAKAYTGTVEKLVGTTASITLTDNGPAYGDTVEVTSEDGTSLGTGELYIHDELKVIGFAGTVSAVNVKENASVSANAKLLTLTDTSYTATYETLIAERAELEEEFNELVSIYKEGGIYASISGTVKTVSAEEGVSTESASASASSASVNMFGMQSTSTSTSTSSSSDSDKQYISISPDKTMSISVSIDESDILSVSVGQSAAVSIDSIENETFAGTVTEIDRSGTSSGGVTTYTASISIEKTSAMLSGMSASATITIDSVDDALLIPVDALNKTSTGYYVYTTYDEVENTLGGMTEVSIGISNANYVEITSGLAEGDTVYYSEEEEESPFGNMQGGFGGGDFDISVFSGGDMPSGGFSGGNMPGGGNMPSGGGMQGGPGGQG